MPHLIIDCPDDLFTSEERQEVMQIVFDAAVESGLFGVSDIKVRLRPFSEFITGGTSDSFVHIFGYIMEGRSVEQKNALSKSIVGRLKEHLPGVPVISMNVMDFEKATYNNRNTVQEEPLA